jgi:hypothetical protein
LNIFHDDNAFYKYKLIGVANLFLDILHKKFYQPFEYSVPIINQQGEISGRLKCKLQRIKPEETNGSTENSENGIIKFHLSIIEANDLALTHMGSMIFCQYQFWSQSQPTLINSKSEHSSSQTEVSSKNKSVSNNNKFKSSASVVRFDHEREFEVEVNEEFQEYCQVSLEIIVIFETRNY